MTIALAIAFALTALTAAGLAIRLGGLRAELATEKAQRDRAEAALRAMADELRDVRARHVAAVIRLTGELEAQEAELASAAKGEAIKRLRARFGPREEKP